MSELRTPAESTLRDYRARMLRVLVYIQEHLDDPLDLDALAGVACFSPYHFHRMFRGMVGETVMAHIRRLRLERAAARLKLGDRTVTDIAFEAGYETHEAFTRAFHDAFGASPTRFRSERRPPLSPSGVHFHEGRTPAGFRSGGRGVRSMNVEIRTVSSLRVAFVRHVGPYDEVGEAWDRLLPRLGSMGYLGAGSLMLGVCHDDPEVTAPEKIRYDACVTVDDRFAPEGDIGVQVIPGGDYAVTVHQGPYDRLGETYARLLGQWLPRSGREPASSPCFEVYLTDPESTDPEDALTEIYAPLAPLPTGRTS